MNGEYPDQRHSEPIQIPLKKIKLKWLQWGYVRLLAQKYGKCTQIHIY